MELVVVMVKVVKPFFDVFLTLERIAMLGTVTTNNSGIVLPSMIPRALIPENSRPWWHPRMCGASSV